MKRNLYIILSFAILLSLSVGSKSLMAQEPPHPPTTGHGTHGNQNPGGTAPIDGGLGIIIALGLAYGTRKSLQNKSEE
ncbi:MAG: hypothetical protein IPH88_02505 [Bacteroidales bacterium]|nr:hypothetical protein [Bacteroidales bacterium]